MQTMELSAQKHRFRIPVPFVRREILPQPAGAALICTPAGWGKTAYLSQLARDCQGSACISAGAEDNSAARITALLSEALPDAGIADTDSCFEAVSKAASVLSKRENGLLLFDNASEITEKQASSLLRLLAGAAADGHFSIVFAAEEIPSWLLSFVMEKSIKLIGTESLRFSPEETAALAELVDPSVSEGRKSSLAAFTGGWAVAVRELAEEKTGDLIRDCDASYLPEYIQSFILSPLPADVQRILKISAFLRGDEDFYRDALKLADYSSVCSRLKRMGIFSSNADEPELPEVMSHLLSKLIPSEEREKLVEQATDYYIRHKRFAEAVRLFEVSGNTFAAERILQLYGDRLLANCEFELIGYCGRIIGSSEQVSEPQALGALAQYYYYSGEYEKMEQAFNRADSMFGKENRYSTLRKLYNGLLRYEKKPELYAENVLSAASWLRSHEIPMPFLYRRELDIYDEITARQEEKSDEKQLLYISRFGTLQLSAGSKHTEIQCKTRRSHELIAYMLEHGDKPIGRDELLNAFWYDDMPANAVAMLHNMIYHLRRELSAFGLENIIRYKNKYYTLDTGYICEDDRDIIEVCEASESGNTDIISSHEELLRQYWGAYLGNTDILWANEKREYYDRCYINACNTLSGICRAEGRYEDALLFLKNAYRLDPYSEQLISELLECYSALGKPDKARLCYEEYARRLDEEFGTRPGKWLRNRFFSCFAEEP